MPSSVPMGITGLSSRSVPRERWVVVGSSRCCVLSPFCASQYLRLPQQVLFCLWCKGDTLHSCNFASGI